MNLKLTTISAAVGMVMGGAAFSANASLTSSATLNFTLGSAGVVACNYGTTPPCLKAGYNITDIVGSYFSMDTKADGLDVGDKTPIGSNNGLHIGTAQGASGSHSGSVNGSENPNIDNPWTFFFGGTGMHQTTSVTSVAGGSGDNYTLNLGWNVTWNGIPSIALTPQGNPTVACSTGSSCSDTSSYTLDGAYHVNGAGFTTVAYTVHLEGTVSAAVPVPAAVWLFGSGLLGLVGVARRKKSA